MSVLRVTLVRHGQTTRNHEKKIQSRTDALLSELGEFQGDQLGQYLASEKFTHVYASNLTRTQQTARRILKHNQNGPTPEIVIDSRIRERDFGDWEGEDVEFVFDTALKQGTRMHRLSIPNGQTFKDFSAIGFEFFKEICELTKLPDTDYNILVVTHGAWILTLFDTLTAYPELFTLENYIVDESIRSPPNSSFTTLTISLASSGKYIVRFDAIFNTNHFGIGPDKIK